MTRWKAWGLLLGLLACVPLAAADVSVNGGEQGGATTFTTVVVTSSTNSAGDMGVGTTIRGFKLVATAANAACGLYDAATTPASGTTGYIDELYEATSGETNLQLWTTPYILKTDLSVEIEGAACTIYLQ